MRCYLPVSVVFVAFFGLLVAGDDPKTVVKVDVYYESLCPDSIRWIKEQLMLTYPVLKDHIDITFVPYGKATHTRNSETGIWEFSCQHGSEECRGNRKQACGIHVIESTANPEDQQQMTANLVGCVMSNSNPPYAVRQCARQIGFSAHQQALLMDCMEGPLSDDLLAANGDKTRSLNPPLSFVPTIVINGVYSRENQSAALNNFAKLICSHLSQAEKSAVCSNID